MYFAYQRCSDFSLLFKKWYPCYVEIKEKEIKTYQNNKLSNEFLLDGSCIFTRPVTVEKYGKSEYYKFCLYFVNSGDEYVIMWLASESMEEAIKLRKVIDDALKL